MPLNNKFENLNSSDRFASPGFFEGLFKTLKGIFFGEKEDVRSVGLLKYKGNISYKGKKPMRTAPPPAQPVRPIQTMRPAQSLQPTPPLAPQPLMQKTNPTGAPAIDRFGRIQPQKYTNKRI